MTALDRYLGARTLAAVGTALVGLVALFSLVRLARELGHVGSGSYGVLAATRFVLHLAPIEAVHVLVAAVLVGTVVALGDLSSSRELVALWALGVSRARVVASLLLAVLPAVALALGLGELLAAPLAREAHAERSVAVSAGRALPTASGLWAREGSRFVNVQRPAGGGELGEVYVYEFDGERRLRRFLHARRAVFAGGRWRLSDVMETRLQLACGPRDGPRSTGAGAGRAPEGSTPPAGGGGPRAGADVPRAARSRGDLASDRLRRDGLAERGEGCRLADVSTRHLASVPWATTLLPGHFTMLEIPPGDLSAAELWSAVAALARRGESAVRYRAALWRRLALPLAAAAMVVVAMAFLASGRSRGGVGPRTVVAVLAGIGFQFLDETAVRFALVVGLPVPLASAALPALLLSGGGLWLSRAP